MKNEKLNVIICPKCGREYLPGEIYIPKCFIGSPKYIDRDNLGKITYFDGTTMNTNETYVCEECGVTFGVKAQVNFKTFINEKMDFSTDYKSPLKEKKLSLFEG